MSDEPEQRAQWIMAILQKYWPYVPDEGGSMYALVRREIAAELRSAVEAERARAGENSRRAHSLIATMFKALPWGALKGALMEDPIVKAARRAEERDTGRGGG